MKGRVKSVGALPATREGGTCSLTRLYSASAAARRDGRDGRMTLLKERTKDGGSCDVGHRQGTFGVRETRTGKWAPLLALLTQAWKDLRVDEVSVAGGDDAGLVGVQGQGVPGDAGVLFELFQGVVDGQPWAVGGQGRLEVRLVEEVAERHHVVGAEVGDVLGVAARDSRHQQGAAGFDCQTETGQGGVADRAVAAFQGTTIEDYTGLPLDVLGAAEVVQRLAVVDASYVR
jgi:hypothetical protein